MANPTGMSVVSGSATAQQTGSRLNVNVGSPLALLNWSSFNIAAGESTSFNQLSSSSVVINQIGSANPSQIYGSLTANGTVILANQHGFYFGPNSYVAVGGNFIATTTPLPPDIGENGTWQFTGPPPLASIVNYGQVNVGSGKSLFLIAENIQNSGTLNAPDGNIGLAAGQSVLLSDRADGRGLAMQVTLPQGSVNNEGKLIADGGMIAANAQVINQNGIVQADTVQNQNGVIELTASDDLNLGAGSETSAHGDDSTPGSSGGTVTLKSGNTFSDSASSDIVASGGAQGGNGGSVEISAPNILSLDSTINAGAQEGWSAGAFSLDPENIVLGTSGTTSPDSGGTINGTGSSGTLNVNVDTAFQNITAGNILLEASGNITLNTPWNITASVDGQTSGQLTLEAGGNIVLNSSISDPDDWSVNLYSGYNFANNTVTSGTGTITIGNNSIQTTQGAINLVAGENITIGSGSVTTTGGGSIFADALAGTLNCGTKGGSYDYSRNGYTVGSLGGISTGAGGNVTLEAGNNIVYVPPNIANQDPGSSGAWGPEPGNVTVIAGDGIIGNFIVANGTGLLESGVSVDGSGNVTILNPSANIGSSAVNQQVNLSLISGNWYAYAANNLFIGEVRNPNGSFNAFPMSVPFGEYLNVTTPTTQPFLYDYATDAGATFWAGNSIVLGLPSGNLFPRTRGVGNSPSLDPIYPSRLSLETGSGGITLLDSITLFPSSEGSLSIVTDDGGSLNLSTSGIIMSGSESPSFTTFGGDNGTIPLHLNDPTPANPSTVYLNISGDISGLLQVPTEANIIIGGDADDFRFTGQNNSANAITTISVAGSVNDDNINSYPWILYGPGFFNITVGGDMDIAGDEYNAGLSGIDVVGPNSNLVPARPDVLNVSPYGADLNITVGGSLSLVNSQIVDEGIDGNITLNVGGELDAGNGNFSSEGALEGIYTTSGGNVSVTANNDVNVDGSRIATYGGGNISVTSLTGDVNAGSGGQGGDIVWLAYLNSDGDIAATEQYVSGSGILQSVAAGSPNPLGGITVSAPDGSINASAGGIAQLAFNGNSNSGTHIDLDAGQDINAYDSGVIGYNLSLKAGVNINGLFIGAGNVKVNAGQNFGGTLIGSGNVAVSAGGSISGSIVGGGISASGNSITASLISTSVSASGNTVSAPEGIPAGGVPKEVLPDDTTSTSASDGNSPGDWRKKKKVTVEQATGQVTVVLPKI